MSVTVDSSARASARDGVSASNELAIQYAALAETASITSAAASSIGFEPEQLIDRVEAAVNVNQNLIRITVSLPESRDAQAAANAVAATLVSAVAERVKAAMGSYEEQSESSLEPIDAALDDARSRADAANQIASTTSDANARSLALANLSIAQSEISALQQQRQAVLVTSLSNAPLTPTSELVEEATVAELATPNPAIYGPIAILLLGLLAARIFISRDRRRMVPTGLPSSALEGGPSDAAVGSPPASDARQSPQDHVTAASPLHRGDAGAHPLEVRDEAMKVLPTSVQGETDSSPMEDGGTSRSAFESSRG
ncbi:hypothetical protein [Blastococcus litoris]|uniref:hypothetical protein n=1 Tax=Blastococcus litoris TaxID=2171622 RepID=UPI000E306B1C|nr:hypothetical protein [Blastococcus litoris]